MEFSCKSCIKKYSSYQSLWLHNKKYHVNNKKFTYNNNINGVICEFCNRNFSNKYSIKKHIKTCDIKKEKELINTQINIPVNTNILNDDNTNIQLRIQLIEAEQNKIKEEQNKIKEERVKIEAENRNLELKLKFEKLIISKCKMHPKTFKSLNNKLINNSMNNNTINNNIINNFKIYTIGKENLLETLTLNEKKDIMRSRFNCLERIVEIAHCSKYDQFKNIIITNLKDKHAFKYDDEKGYFVCINKNELISDLICERLGDIEEIYEELSTTNKLDLNTKRLIKEFLDKIKKEDTYDIDGTTYHNFKSYNEHKVKILIYNSSDKINQDLTIIFESLPSIEY